MRSHADRLSLPLADTRTWKSRTLEVIVEQWPGVSPSFGIRSGTRLSGPVQAAL